MSNLKILIIVFCVLLVPIGYADQDTISLFPLQNYDQHIANWIKSTDANYDQPLVSRQVQQANLEIFYDHFFGKYSPWDAKHVKEVLSHPAPDNLKGLELELINMFSNKDKSEQEIGYGENFRPHPLTWIQDITNNINLSQLETIKYRSDNLGIMIENANARALPTDNVHFYSYKIAGQGYPFDNLQISSVWVGTPVYILGKSRDRDWTFVMTPDYIAWVKSATVAHVSQDFVETWKSVAKKHLVAITKTQTSIIDTNNNFRFLTYVGTVFPGKNNSNEINLMIPVLGDGQYAQIRHAIVSKENASSMPLIATPHHFRNIISTLLGRPYGWGNMYFYNDCSGELKNLFTPFGFWLPRHSSDQVYVGKMLDLSDQTLKQRLSYLKENGHRFFTLVYVGGHIVLYVGNYPNPFSKDHESMVMSYQDMWALSPHPSVRRAVVGKSVFFPLLEQYPEDTSLISQADKKYFQISQLDETPNYLRKLQVIDLKALMYPN